MTKKTSKPNHRGRKKPKEVEYHPAIDRYMHMVESGEIEACQEQHALIKFLRGKLENAVIKSDLIDKAIARMNKHFDGNCYHGKSSLQRSYLAFTTWTTTSCSMSS